jgi:hypothetical protein
MLSVLISPCDRPLLSKSFRIERIMQRAGEPIATRHELNMLDADCMRKMQQAIASAALPSSCAFELYILFLSGTVCS